MATIGNSWTANHAKMFYQECGRKAKSIMQGAAYGKMDTVLTKYVTNFSFLQVVNRSTPALKVLLASQILRISKNIYGRRSRIMRLSLRGILVLVRQKHEKYFQIHFHRRSICEKRFQFRKRWSLPDDEGSNAKTDLQYQVQTIHFGCSSTYCWRRNF